MFFFAGEDTSVGVNDNGDRVKLKSGSRKNESYGECVVTGTNTGLTTGLSIQRAFKELSSSEQEELLTKLYYDEEIIKLQFGSLVTATCYSFEKRVSIDAFRVSILQLKAYEPAPGEQDPSLLGEHSGEIKAAKSIAVIFTILTPYWNYLNHEILNYIIKEHGSNDDTLRLEKFDEDLKKFCERRIFELPLLDSGSSIGRTPSNQEKFVVKFDKPEDIKFKELLKIRRQIAEILHVNLAAFQIQHVKVGCVQLTFLVPKFLARDIFPLSCEQTSALSKDASVVRLECGYYVYKV